MPQRSLAPVHLPIRATWDGVPVGSDEHVDVFLEQLQGELELRVEAPSHGDPPPLEAPGPTWALWEHEAVELFLLGPDEQYLEVEIGPHGHYLVLRLNGRRQPVATRLPMRVTWAPVRPGYWSANAVIPEAYLPPRPWRANAYAMWGQGTARRYLAWAPVPGATPDFHRLEHFRELER